MAIVTMQPPATSAVYRALHPDDYDRTRQMAEAVDRLEILAVLMAQQQALLGNQSGVPASRLPSRFSDLIEDSKPPAPQATEEQILASLAQIDAIYEARQQRAVTSG